MNDLVIMQAILAAGAVALMGYAIYSGTKLRAIERAEDREAAARDPAE